MTTKTDIVLSASDQTRAAFASVRSNMAGLDQAAKEAKQHIGELANTLGVGLSGAAIVSFVKGTIDAADNLNDLSQSVGIAIKDLATWQLAANQSGTSIESVAKGVKGLSSYMFENGEALRSAGISATDANGALIQLADIFADMPDGVDKTTLAVKLFRKPGLEMIPMLNLGSRGLAEAAEKARLYGERIAAVAPLADEFNDRMEELALQSKIAGLNIADKLLPGLIGLTTWMNDLAVGGKKAESALEFLSEKSPMFKGLVKLHEILNGGEGRAVGFTGGKNALGLPISAAEKAIADMKAFDAATDDYLDQRARKAAAEAKARQLLAKEETPGKTKAPPLFDQHVLDAQRQAVDDFRDLQRLLKTGEENQLAAYYETAGEEVMRLVAEQRNLKPALEESTDFVREAARNMQDAMADGFFDIMQGRFDKLGASFKSMLDRMVANAIAADLANRLLGDIGKTGKVGGWAGDLLQYLFKPGGYGDAAGLAAGVPQFAAGTAYVPRTGLAMIHQGERIIPADQNRGSFGGNIIIHVNGAGNAQDVRRAAGQGAREALAAFSGAQRYA